MDYATYVRRGIAVIVKLFMGKKTVAGVTKKFTTMLTELKEVEKQAEQDMEVTRKQLDQLYIALDDQSVERQAARKVRRKLAELLS